MGTVAIRTVGVGMAPDELSRLANEVATGALFISAQDSRGRTILGAVYVTPDGDLFGARGAGWSVLPGERLRRRKAGPLGSQWRSVRTRRQPSWRRRRSWRRWRRFR